MISAFIKSIRGCDPDAALHYLARMLVAGEDPRFVARRLMVHASEDVGLADPTALQAAVAAAQVVQLVGLPECPDRARAGHRAPGDGAEVERGRHGDRRRDVRRARPAPPAPSRRTCATGTTPGAQKLGNAVGYRYPPRRPRARCWPSSTRPTRWSAATTTGRRPAAPSGCWPSGCPSCAGSSAARPARSASAGERAPSAPRRPRTAVALDRAAHAPRPAAAAAQLPAGDLEHLDAVRAQEGVGRLRCARRSRPRRARRRARCTRRPTARARRRGRPARWSAPGSRGSPSAAAIASCISLRGWSVTVSSFSESPGRTV